MHREIPSNDNGKENLVHMIIYDNVDDIQVLHIIRTQKRSLRSAILKIRGDEDNSNFIDFITLTTANSVMFVNKLKDREEFRENQISAYTFDFQSIGEEEVERIIDEEIERNKD